MDTTKNIISELINKNEELFKIICSTHYPFSKDELKLYWNKIIKGNAHYTAYLGDMEKYFIPDFGLCWNTNVVWDDWLKSHWTYHNPNVDKKTKEVDKTLSIGFWDPFGGFMSDQTNSVPLDIKIEMNSRIAISSPVEYDLEDGYSKKEIIAIKKRRAEDDEIFNKEYGELSIETISSFLKRFRSRRHLYRIMLITNKDIWDKTLSKWIDADIIKNLFS